jgi:hypothetical protein
MYQNQGGVNRPSYNYESDAKCEVAVPSEDYVSALDRARHNADEVARALYALIGAIGGPRPEPPSTNANKVEAKRSLKDALDQIPGEIGEACHVSLQRIEEIRQLLRV